MTKAKSTKAVAVVGAEETKQVAVLGAADVPVMLAKVIAEIKAIKGEMPSTPKTGGSIPGFGKIDEIKTLEEIIKAGSSVIGKEKAYREAAAILVPSNVKTPTFKLDGMGFAGMMDHLKIRAIELGNKEKLDKLNKIKETLEANLSAKAKLANDLAKIKAMLMDEDED